MRSILTIFITLLFLSHTNSQSQKDSLINTLKAHNTPDTIRINILNELATCYHMNYPDSAISFATESMELAQKLDYHSGLANALNNIGRSYLIKADYQKARKYLDQALEYAQKDSLKSQMAYALSNIAVIYQYQGDFAYALEYYLQSLKIEETRVNKKGIVKILTNISILYYNIGDYDNSLTYSLKALDINKEVKNQQADASLVNNIGNIYAAKGNHKDALEYYKRSLELNRLSNNNIYVVAALINIGYSYLQIGNIQAASHVLEDAYKLSQNIDAPEIKANLSMNLGTLRSKQKRNTEAIQYFQESLNLALSINAKIIIWDCYRNMAGIYSGMGNYKKAFEYNEKAYVLNDSLRNEEISDKISNIQKGYEINKKQTEINLLGKQNQIKELNLGKEKIIRYFLIAGIIFIFILSGVIYKAYKTKSTLSNELEKQNEEIKTQNEEITMQSELIESINVELQSKALRAQMNPHFLFNSVNSIQQLVLSGNTQTAYDYIAKFSKLMRKVLDHSDKAYISIEEELESLKLYLEIESLRFDQKFVYQLDIEPQLIADGYQIPPLLFQPFIENSIWHGLLHKQDNRKLVISISRANEYQALCVIEDNGVGRKRSMENKQKDAFQHQSKGIDITKERLRLINNQKEFLSSFKIIDLKDDAGVALGTRVEFLVTLM